MTAVVAKPVERVHVSGGTFDRLAFQDYLNTAVTLKKVFNERWISHWLIQF